DTPQWRKFGAIRHQPTMIDVMLEGEHGRQAMFNRELCNFCSMLGENRARLHQHQLRSTLRRRRFEYASEVVSWVYLERLHLQIDRLSSLLGRGELVRTLCVVEHGQAIAIGKHLPQEVNLLSGQV